MADDTIINEKEKQAVVPYFIHEGDMTRMEMAMDKSMNAMKEAMQHMRASVRTAWTALVAVVIIIFIGIMLINNNWIKYAEQLQAEDAGHGAEITEIHERGDQGADR